MTSRKGSTLRSNLNIYFSVNNFQIENALSSDDFGKDLTSAQSLLKKHQLVEVDIVSYEDRINSLKSQCQHFQEIQHFDAVKIEESTKVIVVRFEK